jgi:nitroreductase
MDVFQAVAARRSIRRFKPDPVTDEAITRILEAARLAPSGTNAQPWHFLVIRSDQTRAALREAAYGQRFVEEAPVVIAALGDRKRYRKRLRRASELVELGAVDPEVVRNAGNYRKQSDDKEATDRAIVLNVAIAAEHMALAATALGLGSCWVMLMDRDRVAELLGVEDPRFPVALMPLGVPDQAPAARPRYDLSEIASDQTLEKPWGAPSA